MNDGVTLERDGAVATVVLSNPRRLNAMTPGMWSELEARMDEASGDDGLRAVVLRGTGANFVSGADISVFDRERADGAQAREYGERTRAAMAAVRRCRHPTIALIEGVCVGGGMEIACMCDIRICGESSRFGVTSNRLGLGVGHDELGDPPPLTELGALGDPPPGPDPTDPPPPWWVDPQVSTVEGVEVEDDQN